MGVKKQERTARIDIRVTPEEKEILDRYAKKNFRTITSLFTEWITILAKDLEKNSHD